MRTLTKTEVTSALQHWKLLYGPPESEKPLLGGKAASQNTYGKTNFNPSGHLQQPAFRRINTLLKRAVVGLFLNDVISFEQTLALFASHPEWRDA